MINKDSLIICPVYNEQNTIKAFLRRLRRGYQGDVLFIDDGSTDEGKDFLLSIIDQNTFLKRNPKRRGYGAALIYGFSFALSKGYKRVVTIDVDLQHKPENIPLFLRELMEGEIVLGSRYIKISKARDVPRVRLTINRYIYKLINVLFSVEFTDPFCGLRGYNDSFLKKINLKELSYGIGIEILLEIIRTKAYFREVPIEAIYFKDVRNFFDGLDDPGKRLLHYLRVISDKRKGLIKESSGYFETLTSGSAAEV